MSIASNIGAVAGIAVWSLKGTNAVIIEKNIIQKLLIAYFIL